MSGFVIGAYIPISQFSERVQTVCNLFPASHITILLRNALLGGMLDHIDGNIGGLDGGEFVRTLKELFTFHAKMFGSNVQTGVTLSYIGIILMVSLSVMIFTYSRKYKK